jgi:hypothetical protein
MLVFINSIIITHEPTQKKTEIEDHISEHANTDYVRGDDSDTSDQWACGLWRPA